MRAAHPGRTNSWTGSSHLKIGAMAASAIPGFSLIEPAAQRLSPLLLPAVNLRKGGDGGRRGAPAACQGKPQTTTFTCLAEQLHTRHRSARSTSHRPPLPWPLR